MSNRVAETGPLRVLLVCPAGPVLNGIVEALAALGPGQVVFDPIPHYPTSQELARELRTFSPQVILLSFEKPDTATAVIRYLESETDGLPVVGLHSETNEALLRQAMHCGARDFLTPPFRVDEIGLTLGAVRSVLREAPLSYMATEHIYSFLPAKPGTGTTTVAINTSAALARERGAKVLLSDLDLTCGILRFLLKLPRDQSVVDALAHAEELDTNLWPQLVTRREGFDVLHSGSVNPQAYFEPAHLQGLLDFARCSYKALIFDMSGNLERHSVQVMVESKLIFLVCNPDPGSLFLGREKIEFLRSIGVVDRVRAILNRADQALAIPREKAEGFLGVPVVATFSDDREHVLRAEAEARSVLSDPGAHRIRLANQFRAFAKQLTAESDATAGTSAAARDEVPVLVSAQA